MHAVILAGGFGTRLKPAVADVPKPLAPIGGKPFLAWLIERLVRGGVGGITLSVHHDWKKIRDYFAMHPAPVPLHYAVEQRALGTGGAMAYALRKHPQKAPVLVLNGDSYTRLDIGALYAQHAASGARLSMVLRSVPDAGRYGVVRETAGVVTSFGTGDKGKSGLINAGVYVMEPRLFETFDLPEVFSFEQDFLPPRLDGLKPQSFIADGYFIDIGIPEDYARACRELPEMKD